MFDSSCFRFSHHTNNCILRWRFWDPLDRMCMYIYCFFGVVSLSYLQDRKNKEVPFKLPFLSTTTVVTIPYERDGSRKCPTLHAVQERNGYTKLTTQLATHTLSTWPHQGAHLDVAGSLGVRAVACESSWELVRHVNCSYYLRRNCGIGD